ncbi:MAG: homoserine dehydrogenase [Magnetospirillum sp. WYHS-4]
MSNEPLKVAVAGLGTVGGGTVRLLHENKDILAARCGRPVELRAVAERDKTRDPGVSLDGIARFDDARALVDLDDVDVVVELIGGSGGIAKELCEKAIAAGKHVVTANKALLAHHGNALAKAAEAKGVTLGFEAAVAGGIPIIKAIREGLVANRLRRVYGILNGTCNYILTNMRDSGREFADVLKEAQTLGYAEADPSFDVDGIDTAHKLAILTSIAFGCEIDFENVNIEGIRHVSPLDIKFADELGYRIKLLGVTSVTDDGIEQRVHPCMVPADRPVAKVDGVFNAVVADGDFVDSTVYVGRGAGARPTASAVVSDIADIARGRRVPTFGVPAAQLRKAAPSPMDRHKGEFYLRLMVLDRPGVFADVANILARHEVSMGSVLQHGRAPGEAVPVVVTLHETEEARVRAVLGELEALDTVVETPRMIRIEAF